MSETPDPIAVALDYHERTKHQLHRYARSLGYMEWATQPDPFRRFEGAPQLLLDEVPVTAEPRYDALYDGLEPQTLDRASLSQFFYDALALSAWKEYGQSRWSLRVNPSSGNLHPTEGYLLSGPVPGLRDTPALYHYAPFTHALEVRRELSPEDWETLQLPPGAFLVGLTSIYWRESWKYGERAFRYCQHDVGHAIAALSLSAAALGWKVQLIEQLSDPQLARLLGVADQTGPEAEHPDTLLLVSQDTTSFAPSADVIDKLSLGTLVGTPNQLSPEHHDWPVIELVGLATEKPEPTSGMGAPPEPVAPPAAIPARPLSARQIIRQRRSAVNMDGITALSREDFFRMLLRVARPTTWLGWPPCVHLALFVHRVRDLAPGLYFLVRNPETRPALLEAIRSDLEFKRVESAPPDVELYCLGETDVTETARIISCHQEIAADGAFAVGMIAHFEPALRQHGAWFYKRLHWEAGAIGQVLYLEAEAAGVRGTGIGCFFDDVMHQALGLKDRQFQTIYHFTVGGPVEDTRLRTAPPYAHRQTP